jgi:hypothetical protein
VCSLFLDHEVSRYRQYLENLPQGGL